MFSLAPNSLAPSQRYTPTRLSPLTPRSHNATRAWHAPSKMFMMPPSPPETPPKTEKNEDNDENAFARIFHPLEESSASDETSARPSLIRPPRRESLNPLNRGADARRGERRRQYLNRVRETRDISRLDLRGDQMLHREFLEQRRERDNWLARDAPWFGIEEEETEPTTTQDEFLQTQRSDQVVAGNSGDLQHLGAQQAPSQDDGRFFSPEEQDEVDAILSAEEREMQELIAMQDASSQDDLPVLSGNAWEQATTARQHFSPSPVYGSEDDEFDQLLLGWTPEDNDGQDTMDMSGD